MSGVNEMDFRNSDSLKLSQFFVQANQLENSDLDAKHRLIDELKSLFKKISLRVFVDKFIECLNASLFHPEKATSVETTIHLAAQFTAVIDSSGVDDEEKCPFFSNMIKFICANHGCHNQLVRSRICLFVDELLSNLDDNVSIDTKLYSKLVASMLERMEDKVEGIRVRAVGAISRLQDPMTAHCPVVKALSLHLSMDPSVEVRQTILKKIAVAAHTLPTILKCTSDVQDLVRRNAFLLISKCSMPKFTVEQRQTLLCTGLNDRDKRVSKCVKKVMLPAWFHHAKNNFVTMLKYLGVETSTETSFLVLQILFKSTSTKTIMEQVKLNLDEDKLIPLDKLSPENAFFWRCAVHFFHNLDDEALEVDKDTMLQSVLPELMPLTNYIRTYFLGDSEDGKELEFWEHKQRLFILLQLLQLYNMYDLSGELQRHQLKQLCTTLLRSPQVKEDAVPVIVDVFSRILPNIDLKEPFTVDENTDGSERETNEEKKENNESLELGAFAPHLDSIEKTKNSDNDRAKISKRCQKLLSLSPHRSFHELNELRNGKNNEILHEELSDSDEGVAATVCHNQSAAIVQNETKEGKTDIKIRSGSSLNDEFLSINKPLIPFDYNSLAEAPNLKEMHCYAVTTENGFQQAGQTKSVLSIKVTDDTMNEQNIRVSILFEDGQELPLVMKNQIVRLHGLRLEPDNMNINGSVDAKDFIVFNPEECDATVKKIRGTSWAKNCVTFTEEDATTIFSIVQWINLTLAGEADPESIEKHANKRDSPVIENVPVIDSAEKIEALITSIDKKLIVEDLKDLEHESVCHIFCQIMEYHSLDGDHVALRVKRKSSCPLNLTVFPPSLRKFETVNDCLSAATIEVGRPEVSILVKNTSAKPVFQLLQDDNYIFILNCKIPPHSGLKKQDQLITLDIKEGDIISIHPRMKQSFKKALNNWNKQFNNVTQTTSVLTSKEVTSISNVPVLPVTESAQSRRASTTAAAISNRCFNRSFDSVNSSEETSLSSPEIGFSSTPYEIEKNLPNGQTKEYLLMGIHPADANNGDPVIVVCNCKDCQRNVPLTLVPIDYMCPDCQQNGKKSKLRLRFHMILHLIELPILHHKHGLLSSPRAEEFFGGCSAKNFMYNKNLQTKILSNLKKLRIDSPTMENGVMVSQKLSLQLDTVTLGNDLQEIVSFEIPKGFKSHSIPPLSFCDNQPMSTNL